MLCFSIQLYIFEFFINLNFYFPHVNNILFGVLCTPENLVTERGDNDGVSNFYISHMHFDTTYYYERSIDTTSIILM